MAVDAVSLGLLGVLGFRLTAYILGGLMFAVDLVAIRFYVQRSYVGLCGVMFWHGTNTNLTN